MNDKLKPCPFCGGKAKTGRYYPYDGYQGESAVYKIYCANCKATIESNSVDSVWELWNRRLNAEGELNTLQEKIENGTLIELPCKIWDTVYMPWEFYGECGIAILSVEEIEISRQSIFTNLNSDDLDFLEKYNCGVFYFDEVGTKVFLTKAEAEAKLKELQGDRV